MSMPPPITRGNRPRRDRRGTDGPPLLTNPASSWQTAVNLTATRPARAAPTPIEERPP